MTSLLKELLAKRNIALEENQEDKAPEGAEVTTGAEETSATPETTTASPDVVDDSAIHGEPGTESSAIPATDEGGTAEPEQPETQPVENGEQVPEEGGAAGASEEGGLGTPEVTEADPQAIAAEADETEEVEQSDVDEAEEAVVEAEEVATAMESLIDRIIDTASKGGLTAREAAIAQTRASTLLKRVGLPEVLFPSQESFEEFGEREANSRLTAVALKNSLKGVQALKADFVTIRDARKAALKK